MTTTPEAYVHLSENLKTLTFYYDTLRADRDGTTWGIRDRDDEFGTPAWTANSVYPDTTVLTAIFDASFRDFRPTTTAGWFQYLEQLKTINGWQYLNTSQVTDMGGMFLGCESLAALDLSSFDTSKVTYMVCMFYGCASLTSLDLSSFDTSKVTYMGWMFSCCKSLIALDLSNFYTSQVTDMERMFFDCESLTSLDLSSFDTSQVTYMNNMFYGCASLTSLDLSSFDTSQVTHMNSMFNSCKSLTTIYCNSSWSASHSDDMFSGCNSLRGAATNGGNNYDVSMANPETGYFTKKVLS